MVHLIRNCVDHGLESNEDRLKAGKPEKGSVRVKADYQVGRFIFRVEDDGGGINLRRSSSQLLKRVIKDKAEMASEIPYLIFAPGF